jgi:hypothetical protein
MLISDDKYVYPNQKLKWEAKINILFLRKKKVEYIVSA